MLAKIDIVRRKLTEVISRLCEVSWMFVKDPERDFIRKRRLPFDKVVLFLLTMEGGSLTAEMLRYFGCSCDMASSSAFVQQREKIHPSAFSSLFDLFVQKTNNDQCYKGFYLLAADGSDIQNSTNSKDSDSYFPAKEGQSAYNLFHLDAMYDLLRHTYTDAVLLGQRKSNERNSLCDMVDRSSLENVLVIADRGYEGFNLMAHIQEKGWNFLIRIQDARKKVEHIYAHKANFSVAVHVCRQFFLGNVSPPVVEALIRKHVSLIRPGRSRPRKMTVKHAVSFIYRVA